MFRNNFKIALRSLFKQKGYTLINIMGLAVGIASCLLIMLYVQHEFSYDKFFDNHERIYRMVLERKYPNHSTLYTVVPHSYEKVAKQDFAEIEESTMVFYGGAGTITQKDGKEEKRFEDEAIAFVD